MRLNNKLCRSRINTALIKSFSSRIINFRFLTLKDNKVHDVSADLNSGKNILKIAHENEIDLEGACDCALACSTCHIILEQKVYDKLPEAEDKENDLLDTAWGLTHTSRLGCQLALSEVFNNSLIRIPSATRNLYVDGHKPKPH